MKKLISTIILVFLCACGGKSTTEQTENNPVTTIADSGEKQLNISILLDLSDRINPKISPNAQKNDIENIKAITDIFRANMAKLGAYKAKGKIKLFFSPTPTNDNINATVNKLSIDCSKLDNRGRKAVYDSITEIYATNLEGIYSETIETSAWEGSDIWRFFKDDVMDFCVEKDDDYRNILIILTDGYLYHKQSVYNNKNRFTYLLGSSNLKSYRKQNWEELIDKNDFGIMPERDDLNNLEVLVLEVKADNQNNKIDEDILKHLWSKWFEEMNVAHYSVYLSALPANTKTRIKNFMSNK